MNKEEVNDWQHPLEKLISFWDTHSEDSEEYSITFEERDTSMAIIVTLNNRKFYYAPFGIRYNAMEYAYEQIVNTAVDMLVDDDIFETYRQKLIDKITNNNDENRIKSL